MSISTTGSGTLTGGPNIALRGTTMIWQQRVDALNQTLMSAGSYGSSNWILVVGASGDVELQGDVANGGSTLNFLANDSIVVGQWYWFAVVIDTSGVGKCYVGKPRLLPGGVSTRVYSGFDFGASSTTAATDAIKPLSFLGFNGQQGAIKGLLIWNSVRSTAEITAAMQFGISSASAWGTGALPPTPWAAYDFTSASDLADHSGNARASFTNSGCSSDSNPVAPATAPASPLRVPCLGDSRTFGSNENLGGYPTVLGTLRSSDTVANNGHFGYTLSQILGVAKSDVVPNLSTSTANIVLVQGGVNDATAFNTGAAMAATLAEIVSLLQALGAYVFVTTDLPYNAGSGGHTEFAANNALILSGSLADIVVDWGGQAYYVPTDLSKYDPDQLHLLTATAYTHEANDWNGTIGAFVASFGSGAASPPLLSKQMQFAPIVSTFQQRRTMHIPQAPSASPGPPLQSAQRNQGIAVQERQPAFMRRPSVAASFAPLFLPRGPFAGVSDSRQPCITAPPIATPAVNGPPLVAAPRPAFVAPADVRALPIALQPPQFKPPDPPPLLGSSPEFYIAAAAFSLDSAIVPAASPPTPPLLSRATVFAALADSLLLMRVALPPASPVADSPPSLTRTTVFSPPIPGWLARSLPGYPIALPPDAPPLLPSRSTFSTLADARVPFRVTAIPYSAPPVVPDAPPLLGRAALFVAPPDAPLAAQRFGVPVSGPIPDAPPLMARLRAATERAPEFAPARPVAIPPSGPDTPPILARWRPADAVAVEYRRNPASLPPIAADAPPLFGRARLFEPPANAAMVRGTPALPPATPPGQPPLTVRAWAFARPAPWFKPGTSALPPIPPPGMPPLIQRRYEFTPPAYTFFVPRGTLIPVSGPRTVIIGRFHASVGARIRRTSATVASRKASK